MTELIRDSDSRGERVPVRIDQRGWKSHFRRWHNSGLKEGKNDRRHLLSVRADLTVGIAGDNDLVLYRIRGGVGVVQGELRMIHIPPNAAPDQGQARCHLPRVLNECILVTLVNAELIARECPLPLKGQPKEIICPGVTCVSR